MPWISKYKKIVKQKCNFYVLLALIACCVILSSGTFYLTGAFQPSSMSWGWERIQPTGNNLPVENYVTNLSGITCKSHNQNLRFVAEDTLTCEFKVEYASALETNGVRLSEIIIRNDFNEVEHKTPPSSYMKEQSYSIDLVVPRKDYATYFLMLNFTNASNTAIHFSSYSYQINLINIISAENYEKWQLIKVSWLIGLLSASFFFVFAAVRNLKEIVER